MNSSPAATDVVIYHNPACGTSRDTLSLVRNAEPHVIDADGRRVTG
jgi:arsenate reductase